MVWARGLWNQIMKKRPGSKVRALGRCGSLNFKKTKKTFWFVSMQDEGLSNSHLQILSLSCVYVVWKVWKHTCSYFFTLFLPSAPEIQANIYGFNWNNLSNNASLLIGQVYGNCAPPNFEKCNCYWLFHYVAPEIQAKIYDLIKIIYLIMFVNR